MVHFTSFYLIKSWQQAPATNPIQQQTWYTQAVSLVRPKVFGALGQSLKFRTPPQVQKHWRKAHETSLPCTQPTAAAPDPCGWAQLPGIATWHIGSQCHLEGQPGQNCVSLQPCVPITPTLCLGTLTYLGPRKVCPFSLSLGGPECLYLCKSYQRALWGDNWLNVSHWLDCLL